MIYGDACWLLASFEVGSFAVSGEMLSEELGIDESAEVF